VTYLLARDNRKKFLLIPYSEGKFGYFLSKGGLFTMLLLEEGPAGH
jgi:hypothetical protein